MFKSICPSCNHIFWKPELKTEKEISKYKWYQIAKHKKHCPNCHVKLGDSKKSKRWNVILNFIIVPFWLVIILGGWPEGTTSTIKWLFIIGSVAFLVLSIKYHEYKIENQ